MLGNRYRIDRWEKSKENSVIIQMRRKVTWGVITMAIMKVKTFNTWRRLIAGSFNFLATPFIALNESIERMNATVREAP
jgi:hypothetical protein